MDFNRLASTEESRLAIGLRYPERRAEAARAEEADERGRKSMQKQDSRGVHRSRPRLMDSA